MRAAVLIVAAGRGRRFGSDTPKQYVPIAGVCALRRCLDMFLQLGTIEMAQVVIHRDDRTAYGQAVEGIEDARLLAAVLGSDTRAKSVTCGLRALEEHQPDVVLVHDAARPFVTHKTICDVMGALETAQAAFAALPVVDALWQSRDGMATDPVPRDGLWRAQTPQGFAFATLLKAHLTYQGDAADDVEIARAMGIDVRLVTGDAANFKVTTPEDLARATEFASYQAHVAGKSA